MNENEELNDDMEIKAVRRAVVGVVLTISFIIVIVLGALAVKLILWLFG